MIWEDMFRLFLAMILGGLIGIEREVTNNPAGFRTHTLVCMGAALVMLTSKSIFETYQGVAALDPLRLGAQVISGIGFLGAGTIIKDGSRVRGLTTAASLWVVACVGLAIGAGLYEMSVGATLLSFTTLLILKKIEKIFSGNPKILEITINNSETSLEIARILNILKQMDVKVESVNMYPQNDISTQVKFYLKPTHATTLAQISERIKL